MRHFATPRFWRCYKGLPQDVRDLADRRYLLLKTDPWHRSLRLKKVGAVWSVRVGLHYRALATDVGDDLVWFWIGSHAEYDTLIGRKPAATAQQSPSRARSGRTPGRNRDGRG